MIDRIRWFRMLPFVVVLLALAPASSLAGSGEQSTSTGVSDVSLAERPAAPGSATTTAGADTTTSTASETMAAAADIPLHLSLRGAVEKALQANPGLLAAQEHAESADRTASASFRQHFGELDAVAWASRYQDDQILRPISKQMLDSGFSGLPFDRDQFHYGLSFELPLFVGGKIQAAVHLNRFKADEAKALLEGTRWQVRSNVITIYAANQAIERALDAYREQVEALEKTHERLQLMVDSGKKPNVDLLKITETLEEAKAEVASAEADREHARAILAALLDRPSTQRFQLDPLPTIFPSAPPDSTDWPSLLEQSSALQTARLKVGQAESGKQLARAEFLPKLGFRANLLEHTSPTVDEGPMETWELSLAASMPIFSGGRRIAAYQSASAQQRAAELVYRQVRRQVEAELHGSLARLTANELQLNAARKRVDAGREAARIEEIRYDTGAGTIEDLLRARTRAASAEAALAKAKGNVLGTAAHINAIVEKEVVR